MQFSFEIKIGETKFTITETAENHKQFVEKVSFFTSLPTSGPNGETDLRFVARNTSKGIYYSIISDKANKEFKLGQSKDMKTLYPKGWEDKYSVEGMSEEEQADFTPAPAAAQKVAEPLALPKTTASLPPKQATAPKTTSPIPVPKPASTSAPMQNPALPPVNEGVKNDILAKYGIKK